VTIDGDGNGNVLDGENPLPEPGEENPEGDDVGEDGTPGEGGDISGGEGRTEPPSIVDPPSPEPRKFYIDGGEVEIIGHLVYDLDTNGKKLQVIKFSCNRKLDICIIAGHRPTSRSRRTRCKRRAPELQR
jgi:type I restriction enzyme R subunit